MFSRRKSRQPESYTGVSHSAAQRSNSVNSNAMAAASAIGRALSGNKTTFNEEQVQSIRNNSIQRRTSSLVRSPSMRQNANQKRSSSLIARPASVVGISDFAGFEGAHSAPPKKANAPPRMITKYVPSAHGLVAVKVPYEAPAPARSLTRSTSMRLKKPMVVVEEDQEVQPEDFERHMSAVHTASAPVTPQRELKSMKPIMETKEPLPVTPVAQTVPAVYSPAQHTAAAPAIEHLSPVVLSPVFVPEEIVANVLDSSDAQTEPTEIPETIPEAQKDAETPIDIPETVPAVNGKEIVDVPVDTASGVPVAVVDAEELSPEVLVAPSEASVVTIPGTPVDNEKTAALPEITKSDTELQEHPVVIPGTPIVVSEHVATEHHAPESVIAGSEVASQNVIPKAESNLGNDAIVAQEAKILEEQHVLLEKDAQYMEKLDEIKNLEVEAQQVNGSVERNVQEEVTTKMNEASVIRQDIEAQANRVEKEMKSVESNMSMAQQVRSANPTLVKQPVKSAMKKPKYPSHQQQQQQQLLTPPNSNRAYLSLETAENTLRNSQTDLPLRTPTRPVSMQVKRPPVKKPVRHSVQGAPKKQLPNSILYPPEPPQRKSSFEKERPASTHMGFKRLSLRAPVEYEQPMGFNQVSQAPPQVPPQPAQQSRPAYNSRFHDSDSEGEYMPQPVPPQQPHHTGFSTIFKHSRDSSVISSSRKQLNDTPSRIATSLRQSEAPPRQQEYYNNAVPKKEKKEKKGLGSKLKKLFGRKDK